MGEVKLPFSCRLGSLRLFAYVLPFLFDKKVGLVGSQKKKCVLSSANAIAS